MPSFRSFTYPLTLNYTLIFNADGSITQNGQVSQEFDRDFVSPLRARVVRNKVNSADTLDLNSSFHITGNSGQQSSQTYSAADSVGGEYHCTLKARNNVLTFASEECGRQGTNRTHVTRVMMAESGNDDHPLGKLVASLLQFAESGRVAQSDRASAF